MPRKEPRDYKKEYREYHGNPEQRKNRSMRNKARRLMIKKGKVRKGDGMEVDHHDGNPRNNHPNNLRIMPRTANRKKGDR
jgi:hypothetical protein